MPSIDFQPVAHPAAPHHHTPDRIDAHAMRQLLKALGTCLGLTDPDALADDRECRVDGLPLSVPHAPHDHSDHSDRLMLHFDLGPVPAAHEAVALQRLLQLNLLSGSKTTGVLALSPFGRTVVYAVHLFNPPLGSPEAVAQAIRHHASLAHSARALMHADVA